MVRKGEKGTPVIFWKRFEVKDKATGEKKQSFLLRYYTVFNVEQCDGIEWSAPAPVVGAPFNPIPACAAIVEAMPQRPDITHGGNRACYSPMFDKVNMPEAVTFDSPESYYSVLFHELTHATGHKDRLGRDLTVIAAFGDSNYSKEELVAEMGAAFLCGHAGIANAATVGNSASYIAHWLAKLRGDSKLVVSAAGLAQKASDFILGVDWNAKPADTVEAEGEAIPA